MSPTTVIHSLEVDEGPGQAPDPNTVTRVWRVKLLPNKAQKFAMDEQREIQRHLYNRALRDREAAFEQARAARQAAAAVTTSPDPEEPAKEVAKSGVNLYDQKKRLITAARHDPNNPAYPYITHTAVGCSQQTLMRLDRAYQKFFKDLKSYQSRKKAGSLRPGERPPGKPRPCRYGEFDTLAFNGLGQGIRVDLDRRRVMAMYIPGEIKFCLTQRHKKRYGLPPDAILKAPALTWRPEGWYFSATVQMPAPPPPDPCDTRPEIGIVVGIEPVFAATDGVVIPAPRFYREAEPQLANAQRRVSRRQHTPRKDPQGELICYDPHFTGTVESAEDLTLTLARDTNLSSRRRFAGSYVRIVSEEGEPGPWQLIMRYQGKTRLLTPETEWICLPLPGETVQIARVRRTSSNRRRKAVKLLARAHRRIANRRTLWQRTLAAEIARDYAHIVIESRHPRDLIGKPVPRPSEDDEEVYLPNQAHLIAEDNKALLDNAWSQFLAFVKQAAAKRGCRLSEVPQFEPTQRCSRCGVTHPRPAGNGDYHCGACGFIIGAIENNVRNVLQDGLLMYGKESQKKVS
jgi:transposase